MNGPRHVVLELAYHAPFTALGTMLGLILVSLLIASSPPHEVYESSFHVLHPIHMFLSAVATTAVYYRHRPRVGEAVLVGMIGSVAICSVSDIALPYLGGVLLGIQGLELHVCLIKHPWIVLIPALLGCLVAVKASRQLENPSLLPHGGHVMISVLASISYLAAFSNPAALISTYAPQAFIIVFVAVLLPCCTSDIVLPVAALPSHELDHDVHVKRLGVLRVGGKRGSRGPS